MESISSCSTTGSQPRAGWRGRCCGYPAPEHDALSCESAGLPVDVYKEMAEKSLRNPPRLPRRGSGEP